MAGHPGYWREADGTTVPQSDAETAWAQAAMPVLQELATVYGALIDYRGFAAEVQQRSGIATRVPVSSWIGGVLRLIMKQAAAAGEPPLSSLVVPKIDASVGATTDSRPRLMCYSRYGATMPDEARLVLNPPPKTTRVPGAARSSGATSAARATPRRSSAPEERPPAMCPRCFIALPATGVCDTCG